MKTYSDIDRWREEIAASRLAVKRLRALQRAEVNPLEKVKIGSQIGERQQLIRDRLRAIALVATCEVG